MQRVLIFNAALSVAVIKAIRGLMLTKKTLFLILAILPWATNCYALDVTLTIDEPASVARTDEVINFGVPIAEQDNIVSVSQLGLTGSDGLMNIPAQFTVLSRWGGARSGSNPIRWVLVDFQDTIDASGTNTYHLKDNLTGNATGTNLYVSDNTPSNGYVTVETGNARFVFEKARFAFNAVYIDSDGDNQIDDRVAGATSGNGLILTDTSSTEYQAVYESDDNSQEFEIEKDGPLHSILMWRGVFKTGASYYSPSIDYGDDGSNPTFSQVAYYPNSYVYWAARLHFYNGKDFVRVEIALENNGFSDAIYSETYPVVKRSPDQAIDFDSLEFIITPHSFLSPSITTDEVSQTALNTEYKVTQTWKEEKTISGRSLEDDIDDGTSFTITNNSSTIGSGLGPLGQSLGWIEYDEGNKTISVLTKDFWQNFPKTYTLTTSSINIGIWPGEFYYPWSESQKTEGYYTMRGGTHKIHEFIMSFSATDGQLSALGEHLEYPLIGVSDNISSSKAGGIVGSASVIDAEIQDEIDRYDSIQLVTVDSSKSTNGRTWDWYRKINHGQNSENYGWEAWGDLPWNGPYTTVPSSLHYDQPGGQLTNFFRNGNYGHFAEGYAEAMHRIVDHTFSKWDLSDTDYELAARGMSRWESDSHGDSTVRPSTPYRKNSHIWAGGLAWLYWATGSEWAYETIENLKDGMESYFNFYNLDSERCFTPANAGEHRLVTWPGLSIIWAYRVMGSIDTLQWIEKAAKNYFLVTEKRIAECGAGYDGYFGSNNNTVDCSSFCPTERSMSTQRDYLINFLINAQWETGDSDLADLIIRMADFDWDEFLIPSDEISPTDYKPISEFDNASWWSDDRNLGTRRESCIALIFHADLAAYAYYLSGDSTYLDHAKAIFSDYVNYPGAIGTSPWARNPSALSPIKIGFGTYSGSETKTMGWSMMGGKTFLYALESGPATEKVSDIKVTTNRWPDTSTPVSFKTDVYSITKASTDEEKALSLWRYLQTIMFRTANYASEDGVSLRDFRKVVNVYGGLDCDRGTEAMRLAWLGDGKHSWKTYYGGHTQPALYYDDAYHVIDASDYHYFLRNRDGDIVTTDDIASDPSLLHRPYGGARIPANALPPLRGWIYEKYKPDSTWDKTFDLRGNESVTFYYHDNGDSADLIFSPTGGHVGSTDVRHGGYTIEAGVAEWIYSPDDLDHDSRIEFSFPYPIYDASITLTLVSGSVDVYVSTDGVTWGKAVCQWSTAQTYTDQDLGPVPDGEYGYYVRLDLSSASVTGITVKSKTQHNFFALPLLQPVENKITLSGTRSGTPTLKTTFIWNDDAGTGRKHVRESEAFDDIWSIEVDGDAWDDVVVTSLKVECLPAAGGEGNRSSTVETAAVNSTDIDLYDYYSPQELSDYGGSLPPPLETEATYREWITTGISTNNWSRDDGVQEALIGLMYIAGNGTALDVSTVTAIESVIKADTANDNDSPRTKEYAMDALYIAQGGDAVTMLDKVLDNDASITWKDDQERVHCFAQAAYFLGQIGKPAAAGSADRIAEWLDDANPTTEIGQDVNNITGWSVIRLALARSLGQLGSTTAHANELIEEISPVNSGDETKWALWGLGQIGDPSALDEVKAELAYAKSDGSINMSEYYAIKAIGLLGDLDEALTIYEYLHNTDPSLRAASAEGLSELGAIDYISSILSAVVSETYDWVSTIMGTAVAILESLIDSDNDGVPDDEDLCPGFDDSVDVDADGIPDGCDDNISTQTTRQGFDYVAYLLANPDLPSGWRQKECMDHYKLFGFWENRAVAFNLAEYLNANTDLPSNWIYDVALVHYRTFGISENRLLAFDAQEYLSLYPDLPQNWTYDQAYSHYIYFGRQEGRIASFDETAYLELYSDLPRSWGQPEAFYHYVQLGQYEGRVYDPYDEDVFLTIYSSTRHK